MSRGIERKLCVEIGINEDRVARSMWMDELIFGFLNYDYDSGYQSIIKCIKSCSSGGREEDYYGMMR